MSVNELLFVLTMIYETALLTCMDENEVLFL